MISGNLEYLMSSLPHLSFHNSEELRLRVSSTLRKYADPSEKEPDLMDILDTEAEKYLSPEASRLLRQINLNGIHDKVFQQSNNRLLSAFSKYMFSLKEAVQLLRMSRKADKNSSSQHKQLLPIKPGTPLEEEIQLMKDQWDQLEELSIGHYADFSALAGYKLKLMILLRWWSFDIDRGFEVFTQMTKQNVTWPIRS